MSKQIVIAEQHRIAAVFAEDQIQELVVATGSHQVSDIYLGIVENVLPGIDAAFVNIGDSERNGFIHVSDLGPLRLKRSASAITELLAPQQKVLVQVMKEPTGTKGPRLTGNITLPGRYLVLMPFGRGVNLSRRVRNEGERNRLRALAVLIKPSGMGLLVRTEAEGRHEEAIMEDLEDLQRRWESIQQEAQSTRAPALLNRDDDFIQRVLRDMYTADVNRTVVDSSGGLKRVKHHLMGWSGGKPPQGLLIEQHTDRTPILEYFRVNAAIREALKPRVDLPSGGYIIIETTEALTVIDVNSGSFTRSATARETVLWTNCEAATETARQLRLRNVAGVIVVDFIDMDSRRDQLQVLEHFTKALRADKARPQIAQLSELGLVELTRKRQGQNIYELFGRACPTCGGLGHLVHLPGDPEPKDDEFATIGSAKSAIAVTTRDYSASDARQDSRTLVPQLDPSDDLDPEADALINHPNYQERGSSNRRRRRRRGGFGDGRDEELSTRESTRSSPSSRRSARAAAKEQDNDESEKSTSPRESRSDKGDRSRSSRQEAEKVIEPPEEVFVEMSPEEQDVCALMGISPLAYADVNVKNPQTAIISVVLPGESPAPSNGKQPQPDTPENGKAASTQASSSDSSTDTFQAPKTRHQKAAEAAEKAKAEEEEAAGETPSEESNELEMVGAVAASSSPNDDNGAESTTTSKSSGPGRRRRRRSSAS